MNKSVDGYIEKNGAGWKGEILNQLRAVMLSCDLEEDVKWGVPIYTNHGNVVGIACFKNHVALWFHQGVFLKDEAGVLEASSDNTKGLRKWMFYEGDPIDVNLLRAYVHEAIDNAKAGKKIAIKKTREELPLPEILKAALDANQRAKENFESLTMAQRNEYAQYIGEAKRQTTAEQRLEKCMALILKGHTLNQLYRK